MYLLVPAGPIDSPQIWVYRIIPKIGFHKRPQTHSIKVYWREINKPLYKKKYEIKIKISIKTKNVYIYINKNLKKIK